VTQFQENKLTQFFVQGGKKIEIPASTWDGVPQDSAALTPELCEAMPKAFGDRDRFAEVGGFDQLNVALGVPMVLVMSIWDDVGYPLQTHYCGSNWFIMMLILSSALRQHALARLQLPARQGRHPWWRPWPLWPGLWCALRG
jgi:hypothetical protein